MDDGGHLGEQIGDAALDVIQLVLAGQWQRLFDHVCAATGSTVPDLLCRPMPHRSPGNQVAGLSKQRRTAPMRSAINATTS